MIQLSDKFLGEFTEEDERGFVQFAHLVSMHLETLRDLRSMQDANAEKAPWRHQVTGWRFENFDL